MTQPAARDAAYRPAITVAVVVAREGKLLFVEEHAQGRPVLNQPAGHVESGESLEDAARRETLEETGWHVKITGVIGVYRWSSPAGADFLRFAFAAEPLRHEPERPLDADIERVLWLSPAQLRAEAARLRSPLVLATVEDWCAGSRWPRSLLRDIS